MFHDRANQIYTNYVSLKGLIYHKVAESFVEKLENQKLNDPNLNTDTLNSLKEAWNKFQKYHDQIMNHTTDCLEQQEILRAVDEFDRRLNELSIGKEKSEYWMDIGSDPMDKIGKVILPIMTRHEINLQMSRFFAKFAQSLRGIDKTKFEEISTVYANKYEQLYNYYLYKLQIIEESQKNNNESDPDTENSTGDEEFCKVLELKLAILYTKKCFKN